MSDQPGNGYQALVARMNAIDGSIADRKEAERELHKRINNLDDKAAAARKELSVELHKRIDERVAVATSPIKTLQDSVDDLAEILKEIAPQVRFTSRFWKWCAGVLAAVLAMILGSWLVATFINGATP